MNRAFLLPVSLLGLSLAQIGAAPLRSLDKGDDIAAIKKNTVAFQEAWNKHDTKALTALWTKDGDLIEPWGIALVGREAVERGFVLAHPNDGTGDTAWNIRKDSVRLITPEVALQDWEVVTSGVADGKPLETHLLRVVIITQKVGSNWLIAGARVSDGGSIKTPAPAKATPSK